MQGPHGEALDQHGGLARVHRQACRPVRVGGRGEVVDGGTDPVLDAPGRQARRDPVEQPEAVAVEQPEPVVVELAWCGVHLLLLHPLLMGGGAVTVALDARTDQWQDRHYAK